MCQSPLRKVYWRGLLQGFEMCREKKEKTNKLNCYSACSKEGFAWSTHFFCKARDDVKQIL